mgnify:CR=1 FL=1
MKILIVLSALKYGGAEKQAIVDANSLVGCGYQVTIAYNENGGLISLLSKSVKQYRIKSKNVFLASLQLSYHLLFNKYDIIHCHMFWAEKVSALPGKLTGHKIVFNEHGLGLWREWYHILIMKFISKFADRIITSCDATKRARIKRERLNKDKLVTLYNSFNETGGKNINENISEFLRNKEEFIIGFIGRFNAVKRLKIFIDIAKGLKGLIPNFKIVLVGNGEEMESIKRGIKEKKLEKYFYLPGFELNTKQYYNTFDVFVLPSVREACSVALLEAGASGVPAIAFDVGGNAEIIKDNATGFIIPEGDIDSLTGRIKFFYKNREKKRKMGDAAKEYIKINFSIKNRVQNLKRLYQELCFLKGEI